MHELLKMRNCNTSPVSCCDTDSSDNNTEFVIFCTPSLTDSSKSKSPDSSMHRPEFKSRSQRQDRGLLHHARQKKGLLFLYRGKIIVYLSGQK